VGESILLPALVESKELLLIFERSSDREYQLVVVQTDPKSGLRHHSVSPAAAPPNIMFRTCMVLANIPKKNALDDVFWMALYNMTCSSHKGDTAR
jgi:hypothetical protein